MMDGKQVIVKRVMVSAQGPRPFMNVRTLEELFQLSNAGYCEVPCLRPSFSGVVISVEEIKKAGLRVRFPAHIKDVLIVEKTVNELDATH